MDSVGWRIRLDFAFVMHCGRFTLVFDKSFGRVNLRLVAQFREFDPLETADANEVNVYIL